MQQADRTFVVPRVDDPEYFDHLLALCQEQRIGLLVSLNDLELPLIAQQRERFRQIGTIVVVSSADVIHTCFDKWAMSHFLGQHGFDTPKTCASLDEARQALAQGSLHFPLVVKPRWGTASIGIEFVHSVEELELAYHLIHKRITRTIIASVSMNDAAHAVLIQQRVPGSEYGLDIVNNLDGNHEATFVRLKLAMRAGETDRAVTVHHPQLEALGRALGQQLCHVGNLDCDVFIHKDHYDIIDMNPRFGGGYPFSHVAGANIPAAMLSWARGEHASSEWLKMQAGVKASKYDQLVIVNGQHES
jgi:carbamoyl-phosphate synthase large subunit